jgi:hypothetical protein
MVVSLVDVDLFWCLVLFVFLFGIFLLFFDYDILLFFFWGCGWGGLLDFWVFCVGE